jgi:hypothetical protein
VIKYLQPPLGARMGNGVIKRRGDVHQYQRGSEHAGTGDLAGTRVACSQADQGDPAADAEKKPDTVRDRVGGFLRGRISLRMHGVCSWQKTTFSAWRAGVSVHGRGDSGHLRHQHVSSARRRPSRLLSRNAAPWVAPYGKTPFSPDCGMMIGYRR